MVFGVAVVCGVRIDRGGGGLPDLWWRRTADDGSHESDSRIRGVAGQNLSSESNIMTTTTDDFLAFPFLCASYINSGIDICNGKQRSGRELVCIIWRDRQT